MVNFFVSTCKLSPSAVLELQRSLQHSTWSCWSSKATSSCIARCIICAKETAEVQGIEAPPPVTITYQAIVPKQVTGPPLGPESTSKNGVVQGNPLGLEIVVSVLGGLKIPLDAQERIYAHFGAVSMV